MEAARTLPTSTTSSNRRIPKFTAWMAQCALLPNCSTHWRRQTERRQVDFRLVEMEISVALTQAHGSSKQFRKMLLGEHRGFRPVGLNVSFAQKNHALNLWNNFRYVVRHEQDSESGLRKLAHGVAKLELSADVQSIAWLVKQQSLRIVHQGARNQRALGFAGGHFRNRTVGEMRDAKPRQRFLGKREMFRIGMMVRKNACAAEKTGKHYIATGSIRCARSQQVR